MNFLQLINNFIGNTLLLTEINTTQNSRYVTFYDMVYFVPTWSLFASPVTYSLVLYLHGMLAESYNYYYMYNLHPQVEFHSN